MSFFSDFSGPYSSMENERYINELRELGKRIRSLRLALDITQLDMEVRSGINNADISRIENGQKNIEFYTIVKLAEALEVDLAELFRRD